MLFITKNYKPAHSPCQYAHQSRARSFHKFTWIGSPLLPLDDLQQKKERMPYEHIDRDIYVLFGTDSFASLFHNK